MKKEFGIALIILGVICLLPGINITGNVAGSGVSDVATKTINSVLGLVLVVVGVVLVMAGLEDLSRNILSHLQTYPVEVSELERDIREGYLISDTAIRTSKQESIEREVTSGKLIKKPQHESTYEEKFNSGEATQGGRAIDVYYNIDDKGRLIHFGRPAKGEYLWVVDEDDNFIVANREEMVHKYKKHKLPHPVLAKGKRVKGSGEVIVKNGYITNYNSRSGHYFDRADKKKFDLNSKKAFRVSAKLSGWEYGY